MSVFPLDSNVFAIIGHLEDTMPSFLTKFEKGKRLPHLLQHASTYEPIDSTLHFLTINQD